MVRRGLAAVAVAACFCAATPAGAQYWGGYDRPPPPPSYAYPPPGPRGGYDAPPAYRRPVRGGTCVTGRGVCRAPGIPYGYGCRCLIPGFGPKRGIVQ